MGVHHTTKMTNKNMENGKKEANTTGTNRN
jgi:hypothetical protein